MKFHPGRIDGSFIIEPKVYSDERGLFFETFHQARYSNVGLPSEFLQDNHTRTVKHALRGLHFQKPKPQGKLIWVVQGEIFDVGVDLRIDSPTFGLAHAVVLNESNRLQYYLPPGTAHGFLALSKTAEVAYKCTESYLPQAEIVLQWNDPSLGIDWPVTCPILSARDTNGMPFASCEYFSAEELPG